ncbi:peptidoglycan-associated lipoprotein Pal [Oxalobacteraceae bacterium R-40]|uniref:Peptidoglycan-associated lipoprotein n=1 Tax=Keguizhuia sedimenti TaxID=3064264 RepID=A0ABU1BLB0_9BURK|nr:peptidoglycan-associated lipoprotein Pal [Oxalobacteraceae bacterium R-40]
MHVSRTLALLLSSAFLLSACSSVKLDDKPPVEERSGRITGAAGDARAVAPINATGSTDPLNDPQGLLAKRSIYFDLDSYTVRDEFKPVVEAHARYLNANKSRKIIIQGNTDQRGGREYNLALGQKRAEAVRRSLSLLGVSENQMEAVSFGKEKPKATGSDEAAWAENRRADIVY